MPLSPALAAWLTGLGHDAVHALSLGLDRAPDTRILEIARRDRRIVVTADLDFPRLVALAGDREPGIVLLRGGNFTEAEANVLVARALAAFPAERFDGAIVVVDRKRVRRTPLPIRPPGR